MKNKNEPIRIKPLEIQIYKQGECFICKQPCNQKGYAHFSCCVAYTEHKNLVQTAENINSGN